MTPSPQQSAELREAFEAKFPDPHVNGVSASVIDELTARRDLRFEGFAAAWNYLARRSPAGEGAEPVYQMTQGATINPTWVDVSESGYLGAAMMPGTQRRILYRPAPPSPPVAEGWVSAQDRRKPKPGEMVLLHVRTLHHGWDDEGNERDQEGAEVAMGEYRQGASSEMSYFDCYTSPMSDNDWITHWMPLPPPPALTKAGNEKKED